MQVQAGIKLFAVKCYAPPGSFRCTGQATCKSVLLRGNTTAMQRRLLYIINPISGTRNKSLLQNLIETKTAAAGIPFDVYPSVASGDYSFLSDTLQNGGFTDLVIAGGDGTVNGAIQGLQHYALPFGIVPCGSGNGLAFSAGIPKNPEKALDVVFRGNAQWTDAFTINGRFACMLCGLGFDAQVAHNFALDKNRGLTTYIKKIVEHFFVAKTYPFVLELQNGALTLDAYFISVANSNQFGNNFTIAPKASLTDGLLDVVIMTRQHKLNVLLQTLLQISGFNRLQQVEMIDEQNSVIYFQTSHLLISNPAEAPLHLDGEPADTASLFDIQIKPRSFQLIYP